MIVDPARAGSWRYGSKCRWRLTGGRAAAGLVTEVPPQFRVYILEYMAHLSLKDWQGVGQDFVNLEFVAPGSVHPNSVPGLMDSVGVLLGVLMDGGGAANLDKLQVCPPTPPPLGHPPAAFNAPVLLCSVLTALHV